MSQTTEGVTWDGTSEAFHEGMLFLSNHRDIVLDPSLLNVALLEGREDRLEIGIGSNLLSRPWVNELVQVEPMFCGGAFRKRKRALRTQLAYSSLHPTRHPTRHARLACPP